MEQAQINANSILERYVNLTYSLGLYHYERVRLQLLNKGKSNKIDTIHFEHHF